MLTKGRLHIARPAHLVALEGGAPHFSVVVGSHVRLHPASDLFARGALYAEVRGWDEEGVLYVRPYVGGTPVKGRLHRLSTEYIQAPERE